MMWRLPMLAVLAIGSLGCRTLSRPQRIRNLFAGRDAVVRHGRLKVYRINPAPLRQPDVPALYNHEIIDGPEYPEGETAAEFRNLLLAPASYLWEPPAMVKVCRFEPAIMMRFTNGSDAIDVLASFVCNRIQIFHNGNRLGLHDFDPGRDRLLEAARRIFPDDTYLALMPPRKR